MAVDLDAVEIRVLGCLIEKQRVTPDAYPLSLNSLRLACNQSTNRDPVVEYDEETIRAGLHRLGRRRWTRLASGHTSRAAKYRHLLDETLGLDRAELALLAVLMLRGAQTPGELKQRSERMQPFADLPAVQVVLDRLVERELAWELARRPGQKEERFEHRLGEEADATPGVVSPASEPARSAVLSRAAPAGTAPPGAAAVAIPAGAAPAARGGEPSDDRLERVERALAALQEADRGARDQRLERLASGLEGLRGEVVELRAQLDALRAELGA